MLFPDGQTWRRARPGEETREDVVRIAWYVPVKAGRNIGTVQFTPAFVV